jgi:hypothetical protein
MEYQVNFQTRTTPIQDNYDFISKDSGSSLQVEHHQLIQMAALEEISGCYSCSKLELVAKKSLPQLHDCGKTTKSLREINSLALFAISLETYACA